MCNILFLYGLSYSPQRRKKAKQFVIFPKNPIPFPIHLILASKPDQNSFSKEITFSDN